MNVALAVFAARFGDLIREAREELADDAFGDWLELASIAISRAVADELEKRWHSGDGS